MKIKLFVLGMIVFFQVAVANAKWMNSTAIINLEFGNGIGKILMTRDDMGINFPNRFIIDKENHILLPDGAGRYLVFEANGELRNIISSIDKGFMALFVDNKILFKSGEDYTLYDLEGNLVKNFKGKIFTGVNINEVNGSVIVKNKKDRKYYQYSTDGVLIKVYDKRPLVLGVGKSRNIQGGYLQERRYRDLEDVGKEIKYKFFTPMAVRQFERDKDGFLYAIMSGGGENALGEIRNDIVNRYDQCGKLIGHMQIPNTKFEKKPMPSPHPIGYETTIVESYGQAVIGGDGDVYTWKAIPDTYSIIKWAWIDSPNDPKGGPDAPEEVQALPSTSGVYLTWNPSPQDPGCVTGYDVERSTSATGIFSSLTTVPPKADGAYSFNDEGATAGATWHYRVKATSEIGASDAGTAIVSK